MASRLMYLFALFVSVSVSAAHASAAPSESTPGIIVSATTAPAALRPALAAADADLAAPLREARRSLSQTRKRYPHELPEGSILYVTVRAPLADTAFRMVQARVFGWREGRVQALVPAVATPQVPEDGLTPLSFPETAVLDWTIRYADGREEGNFVGRYLEAANRTQTIDLR